MFIQRIELKDFRSYKDFKLDFTKDIVGIIGENTAGKTSILEAIEILSRGKSSRTSLDSDVVRTKANFSSLNLKVTNDQDLDLFYIIEKDEYGRSKKTYKVNGVSKSLRNFSGNLTSVLFTPEDIRLILGSPGRRRDYLDSIFFQFDKAYKKILSSYNRSLKQINALLRLIQENRAQVSDLDVWLDNLILTGNVITKMRTEFFDEIGEFIEKSAVVLSSGWEMKIKYIPSIISKKKIEENMYKILASKHMLYGPHRDDYEFEVNINGNGEFLPLRDFGSRGQQRIGALMFKLAELEYIAVKTNIRPVLLLDDVFSELDDIRRKKVLDYSNKQQTIITTTDAKNLEYFDDFQEVLLNKPL